MSGGYTQRVLDTYKYVDFYYRPPDGSPRKWQRVLPEALPRLVESADTTDCFYSVQHFSREVSGDDEKHWAEPYVDFDSDDLTRSRDDLLKLLHFAREEMELEEDEIRVWFSGRKGFHALFSPRAFGVEPSENLTYYYKRLFAFFSEFVGGMPTLDTSVYTRRRMWRIPDTKHSKTGLYKTELTWEEASLNPEDLYELCRVPRGPLVDDEHFNARSLHYPTAALARYRDAYEAEQEAASHTANELTWTDVEGDPVCVQDIQGKGIKKPGDRNKATLVLSTYHKQRGKPVDVTVKDLTKWALDLPDTMRDRNDRHVAANTSSVVKAVYQGDNYHFACSFIRSLHGPKTSPGYERVACAGDACPFLAKNTDETPPIDIHLSQIGDPTLLEQRVRVPVRVAGRTESPYVVPVKIEVNSISDECDRVYCELHQSGGHLTKDFTDDTRRLVAMCNVPDQSVLAVIKAAVTSTSCKAFTMKVTEYVRIVEIAAVPKAEQTIGSKGEGVVGDYTYQRCYALGAEQDFKVNSYYEVVGTIHPHPKNQAATLVVTEANPMQDVIENFDVEAALPALKTYDSFSTSSALLGHLLADLSINVARVAGRRFALLATLMTMHSPLYLDWDGERYGGWMQSLIVGDTGEAKSQLVERLLRHIWLGELVNAQNSGRTGLLYTIINKDTTHNFIQWGSIVLNDRRLLTIDEASGLDKEEWAELRNARRDGVFKVSRSVSGEAQSRTRLIMLSNPRYGKNMNEYAAGIEAVTMLFENADIRRFDLVIGFRNGSVSHSAIDRELAESVEHLFTPDVLRANVLWAWSRSPDQIVWTPGTVEAVKAAASRLNGTYEGSGVHLLSQDAGEKIARMTQALAATLHSTDTTHTQVIVLPEHVTVVEQLIESLYSASDLEYDTYVQQNNSTEDVDYDEIIRRLNNTGRIYRVNMEDVLKVFGRNKTVDSFMLEAVSGDGKIARSVLKELMRLDLIKRGRSGNEKTPRFNEVLRRWNRGLVTFDETEWNEADE